MLTSFAQRGPDSSLQSSAQRTPHDLRDPSRGRDPFLTVMVRVGLIGCGTIGSRIALALQQRYHRVARITALHDSNPSHARQLQQQLTPRPMVVSLASLIRNNQLVIEAASVDIAGHVVRQSLLAHRSVFVMSVGGLLIDQAWRRVVRRSRGRVYIPSGALAGLDGVKAMAVGRIQRLSLTTRKPPKAFASAPYIRRKGLQLSRLAKALVVFEGSPAEVVRAFPQNTNVAAALMLAGGDSGKPVRVRVIADPTIRANIHALEVHGDSGRISCTVESRPSSNPKTSELAIRSAIAMLGRFFDSVVIGT